MESSSIGGSASTVVTSVANDGSPPMVADPLDIAMVEYKNYINFVKENKVIMEGWPVRPDGSLADPSSMGLSKLKKLLKLLKTPNSGCGFKHLTKNKWKEWTEKLDQDVETGKIKLPTRKTRSDAGKKCKHETPVEGDGEANSSRPVHKQNIKPKPKKATALKARGSQMKQKKSSASNRISSSDSSPESHLDATSDHLTHMATPKQHTGAQDTTLTDSHNNPPSPLKIFQPLPPINPTSSTQATFELRAADIHPAALQWPTNTQPQPLTPQTGYIGLDLNGAGAQGLPRPELSTPQRPFCFIVSTPEQQAARANSP
ncbi:hypothetical protein FRC11_014045 [Ceratobasidium sp. 423]|nr:hypothetical protein FRC11_014045 [Ceratobasidium sp. 423]